MTRNHLWQGAWIDEAELERRLKTLPEWAAGCAANPLNIEDVLTAADLYSQDLSAKIGSYSRLSACLIEDAGVPEGDVAPLLDEIALFLRRSNLELKLRRELGSRDPFALVRTDSRDSIFEAWAPLGLLVHVAAANSPTVAPLSLVEGLLAGNANFLKTSGSDSPFPALFLDGLLRRDPSRTLRRFAVCARFSSKKTSWIERAFAAADGIVVWGGEEAVAGARKLAPPSARFIEWGHKISLIYLTREAMGDDAVLERAAAECCLFEQQACSSPQCLYLETSSWPEVEAFGKRFAAALARVAPTVPRLEPSDAERAEITLTTELTREESCLGETRVIEDPAGGWRVLLDRRPALAASPLFRTIWVKPLPRAAIVATLRPMRRYLQTVGLAGDLGDVAELSGLMVRAGAVRVRRVGEMSGSYNGEAHDGVYALQRYCRRVSAQAGPEADGVSNFGDFRRASAPRWVKKPPIMTKADFQKAAVDSDDAQLFFKSGGSSGEPKLSLFTYDDYHEQMRAGAEGLFAAGLDPRRDRSMNLFYSGSLYGGFLSIFSVLEILQAVQLPMAASTDFAAVAGAIAANRVNVLLGMPSYLVQLFEKAGDVLGKYGGVEKIFYGGEAFSDAQRRFLREKFGVEIIKSVGYGSVDAGPLGYQCRHCEGGVHHLHQRLQHLEIVNLEKDAPAAAGEIGRLLFTSRVRKGQALERYDLGDVGRWIAEPCPCGRASPRFALLGRSGDVMRIGTAFLNYGTFVRVLSDRLGHVGPVQLLLTHEGLKEKVVVRLSSESRLDPEKIGEILIEHYDDLREAVVKDDMLVLEVVPTPSDEIERVKGSGKIRRIIDSRTR